MDTAELEKLLAEVTPGYWKVCETTIHGRKYGGCWVEGPDVDDGDGCPHGILIPISGSGGAKSFTTRIVDIQCHDHNDANARLIAMAPALARKVIAAEKLVESLAEIARQMKTDELVTECDVEFADFEDGYDACIDCAREAIAVWESAQ